MDIQSKILNGLICPYCGGEPLLTSSSEVYQEDYGVLWACMPCMAWVGVHKGTTRPLGRLANKELRKHKMQAHAHFDPLWKKKMALGFSKKKARSAAYAWLAREMNIPIIDCHIGMFDVEQCIQVVTIVKNFYRQLHEKILLNQKNTSNEQ